MVAEAQEYRANVRRQKEVVYEQYLWRKAMLAGYNKHVDFMMSPAWEAKYSTAVNRHSAPPMLSNTALLSRSYCQGL